MTEREWVKRRLMGYQRDDQSSLWDLLWIHWQSQRRLKRGSREVLYIRLSPSDTKEYHYFTTRRLKPQG